jgi:urease accessory protein
MRRAALRLSTLLPALLLALPAAAHHPTGGMMPVNAMEGLLSGLGHPVIGLDHLAFLVAVGVAAGTAGLGALLPVLFVLASGVGVALHLAEAPLPAVEVLVAASLVLAGGLIARGRAVALPAWGALLVLAGIAHGYAYGEAVVGAETTPVIAYLVGLTLVQGAITAGVALLARALADVSSAPIAPRLAGAAVFGIGVATLAAGVLPGG